jgi:hypothetical protein
MPFQGSLEELKALITLLHPQASHELAARLEQAMASRGS